MKKSSGGNENTEKFVQIFGKTINGFIYPIDELPLMSAEEAIFTCNMANKDFRADDYLKGDEQVYWQNWRYGKPLPLRYGGERDVIARCEL
jgi:hypothetical protein